MATASGFDGFARALPESKNVESSRIIDFLRNADETGINFNSFMLYRNGAVIAEGWWSPYSPDLRHTMHSATKSFLSAAVGLAVAEGYFKLDDKVTSFFPEHVCSSQNANLAAMTVEALLTQTSGHATGASGGTWRGIKTSWITEFFKIQVVHQPGTYFKYSSATSFLLSAIIQKTTGKSTHEFLMPRLLQPLGITDLTWDIGPEGINPGGNGISCRSSDLLKLAVLHLHGGIWNGRQILPRDWVQRATTSQRGNHYGYHWWIGEGSSYYAYGLFGQFAFVFPDHDAIVITTSSVLPGEIALRSLILRHVPKIFGSHKTLAGPAGKTLHEYCQKLEVPLPVKPSLLTPRTDIFDRLFITKLNTDRIDGFSLGLDVDRCIFHLWDHRGLHRVDMGLDRWLDGETTVSDASLHHGYEPPISRIVARAAWSSPNSFHMVWQFVETAFQDHLTIRFIGTHEAILERGTNVNSFATQRPPISACILEKGSGLPSEMQIRARRLGHSEALNSLAVPPRTARYSSSSASLGELLENPETRKIIEELSPNLVETPHLEKIDAYNLVTIASTADSDLKLETIDAALEKIPLSVT
ncbi:MAG: hypothetical protein M1820_007321 [Bogoriella megaspora]|nr:MAG: hypothetical protein M1820_007321 [Bogoriella megaspora]